MNQQILLADKFICDRCKKPGMIESIWKYKELNICTCCANEMRDNKKDYSSDLISMTITDKTPSNL
jgi:hypothetical protein